jgi:hypothetical protein
MAGIKWTGKNLAEIKKIAKHAAHYPEDPKAPAHPRDWSQHPDNLHVEDGGRTLILGIGDTLVKGADGGLSVEKGSTPPRKLSAAPTKGTTHDAHASDGIGGGDA